MLSRRNVLATGIGVGAATLLSREVALGQTPATPAPSATLLPAASPAAGHADEATVDWATVTYAAMQIADRTWMIAGDACTCYLLAGDDRAILIDNGMGAQNIRAFAESVLGAPVAWTINTHGHWDHTGGNQYFDVTYMSRDAELGAKTIYPSLKIRYAYTLDYPIHYVHEGSTIDLGGRTLAIFSISSHSVGDIAILDKRTGSLFAGDNVNMGVSLIYQQTVPQPYVEIYAQHLATLLAYSSYFTAIYPGHAEGPLDVSVLEKQLRNANQVLAGIPGEPMMPDATTDPVVSDGGDKLIFEPQYKVRSRYEDVFMMYDERFVALP